MKANTIRQGTRWSLLSQAVEIVFGLYLLVLVARVLGPDNYGLYQTIISLLVIITLISDFGISQSTSRYIARNINKRSDINKNFTSGFLLKVVFFLPVFVLFLIFFASLELLFNVQLENYKPTILLLATLRSFKEYFLRTFQGIRRLDLRAKYNVVYASNFSFFSTIFLLLGYKVHGILIAESISLTIIILMSAFYLRKKLGIKLIRTLSKESIKNIFKYAIPMVFISLSFYIYTKSDILMLQYFLNSEVVGFYALVTMIIGKVHLPLVAIGQSAGPAFATLKGYKRGKLFKQVFQYTVLLSLPISVGLYIVSDILVTSVFGEEYNQSIPVLKLLSVYLFWYCLNAVTSPVLDYMGYAKTRSITIVILAMINVLLNFYLIPQYGIMGTAYSTLITYTAYSVLLHLIVFRVCFLDNKNLIKGIVFYFFKISLCVLVMAISVYTMMLINQNAQIINLIVYVCIGVISYMFMLLSTKVISLSEVRLFIKR